MLTSRIKWAIAALPIVTFLVPLTWATPAAAAGCPSFPTFVSKADAAHVLDFNFTRGVFSNTDPSATPYQQSAQKRTLVGTNLVSGGQHVYTTSSPVTIHYGQMTYVISPGSIFDLGCSGLTRGTSLAPSVFLESGRISAHDPKAFSGSVITFEGLYNAVPGWHSALNFTVVRTPTKPISTLANFVESSYLSTASVRGVTSAQINGAGHLNVTPYAGPRIGSCRHALFANLNSSTNSASYSGLI